MSKTGRQNQGGSGKPNFTSYKNGGSANKKAERQAKTKQIAKGKELAKQAALTGR